MSRRYSPDHKLLVLRLYQAFQGDVTATSRFSRIPERTLRDWVAQARMAGRMPRATVRFELPTRR